MTINRPAIFDCNPLIFSVLLRFIHHAGMVFQEEFRFNNLASFVFQVLVTPDLVAAVVNFVLPDKPVILLKNMVCIVKVGINSQVSFKAFLAQPQVELESVGRVVRELIVAVVIENRGATGERQYPPLIWKGIK